MWFQNTRAKERRSSRLNISSDRFARCGWSNSSATHGSNPTFHDSLQFMNAWVRQCPSLNTSVSLQIFEINFIYAQLVVIKLMIFIHILK